MHPALVCSVNKSLAGVGQLTNQPLSCFKKGFLFLLHREGPARTMVLLNNQRGTLWFGTLKVYFVMHLVPVICTAFG
jgi:hypothetical protein